MVATQIRKGFIHYKVGCCPVGAATSSRPFLLPTPHSPVGAPICSRPFLFPAPQYPVGAPIGSRPFLLPTPPSRFLIGSGSSFCQVGSSFVNSPYSMPNLAEVSQTQTYVPPNYGVYSGKGFLGTSSEQSFLFSSASMAPCSEVGQRLYSWGNIGTPNNDGSSWRRDAGSNCEINRGLSRRNYLKGWRNLIMRRSHPFLNQFGRNCGF